MRDFSKLDRVTAAETVFGETLLRSASSVPAEAVVTGVVWFTEERSLRKLACGPGN